MASLPLRTIPLHFPDGRIGSARAEGNYAAWMCSFGESVPLLGRCFPSANPPNTVCPSCGRRYKIQSLRNRPVVVAEISLRVGSGIRRDTASAQSLAASEQRSDQDDG